MGTQEQNKWLKSLSPRRLIWPVLIGLAVVFWLFIRDFNADDFRKVNWSYSSLMFLLLAFMAMLVRDLAYVYRIRMLTDGDLSWWQSVQVILLWEFGSAATPTSVGGTTLAILLLAKEGISTGRSTAIIMFSVFLDELVFIIAPILFFIFYKQAVLMPETSPVSGLGGIHLLQGLQLWFVLAYTLIFIYTLVLAYGLFINPAGMKKLLYRIFSWPFLKRWRKGAVRAGTDIVTASAEIKNRSVIYWLKVFLITVISWLGRFMVANFILMILIGSVDQVLVLARQMIMFVIITVSPTPGGSGVAELSFTTFLADFIPNGLQGSMVLLWRIISYYIYLLIGVVLLPRWLNKKFYKPV